MNTTKEHILKTSLALFLRKSYRDVTMKEIVNKTGLSKGAFYHYFESKEDLFREIAVMFISMGNQNYEAFKKDTLFSFIQQYIDFVSQSMNNLNAFVTGEESSQFNLNFFHIMFEASARFPEFLGKELEMHKKDMAAWSEMIEMAKNSGEINTNSSSEDIAKLFLYSSDGIFLRYLNSDSKATFKEFIANTYQTIYNNLKS